PLKRLYGVKVDLLSGTARIILAVVFAAYMVTMAGTLGFKKEKDRVNVLANRLSMDRNISLELQLRLVEEKIASDQLIASLSAIPSSNSIIQNRITESYMVGLSQDNDIIVELFPENEKNPAAITYFTRMVSGGTVIADGTRFRYHRDAAGNSFYTGNFAYYNQGSGVTMLLLTVSPKSNREDRGYARILGYSAPGDVLLPARYSYAKYSSNKLVSYKGNYAYSTLLDEERKEEMLKADGGYVREGGYTHFVNNISDDDLILLSRLKTEDFSYFVAFIFLTLILYFCLTFLTLFRNRRKVREKNYYKSRINAAMMMALVMTLIVLASVSVLFVYRRNNANLKYSMAEKTTSIQTLLEARCRFARDYTDLNTQEASAALEDVSNTMKCDITLYTTRGKEFKSTTPEVFDRMLLGTRMNQDAFENIIYKNRRYFIGKEHVGMVDTYFLYAPVFNSQGNMIAIMGAPFTDESFDFKSEAVLHSITIVTVFMILLLLARLLIGRAVDKMFKPITEVGQKMNEVDINNLEYIFYERDDEVSTLVRAYNLMVHDLYNSTKQLTQAERDKAWATMARQVAHEIKNPLTPIKLQIQRLIRMKSNGNPAWADRFDEISKEVLSQIDMLADTANEFSTFAKLYTEEPVGIDLDSMLKEQIDLFDSRDDITFSYMGLEGAMAVGPKPQLTRVFVNLISNSVQAIENARGEIQEKGMEPPQGQILISLRLSNRDGYYDIVFEDNGPGVSDENRSKLFTPNFTTKSNGTGLGLSICRNIVEKCDGEIFYSKSFTLKGACFTVRYPRG
ncbi:MAG: cache domain-containing protein, partial [Bacteroidales bacterium]|nr:cache domain-containing protein [Bacteroidales bacterium]